MSVKFNKHQRRATASIRIVSDDIVEETESFHLKMVLPSKEVRKKLLKYGNHRRATVYIKDSEYPFNRMSFCQVTSNINTGWCNQRQAMPFQLPESRLISNRTINSDVSLYSVHPTKQA